MARTRKPSKKRPTKVGTVIRDKKPRNWGKTVNKSSRGYLIDGER